MNTYRAATPWCRHYFWLSEAHFRAPDWEGGAALCCVGVGAGERGCTGSALAWPGRRYHINHPLAENCVVASFGMRFLFKPFSLSSVFSYLPKNSTPHLKKKEVAGRQADRRSSPASRRAHDPSQLIPSNTKKGYSEPIPTAVLLCHGCLIETTTSGFACSHQDSKPLSPPPRPLLCRTDIPLPAADCAE